jgi:AcrR family transcriptional regulator
MGIAERKNREKEERKALILRIAKELILEHGIDGLNMQEVADRAELSKATLYLYFENKEAILNEILEDAASTFTDFVRERLNERASGIEAIRALWSAYLEFYGESEEIFILTGVNSFLNPLSFALDSEVPLGGPMTRLIALFAEIISRGIADGTIAASANPVRTARISVLVATSIIDRAAHMPRSARNPKMIRSLLRELFEILLRGLAGRDADPASLTLS